MIKVYQTDRYGIYIGPDYADEDPLEPGRYLIPAGAYTKEPPEALATGEVPVWFGGDWTLMKPEVAANNGQPVPVTNEDVNDERKRRIADGIIVDVEGYGPVALQGRPEDQINLIGLYNVAVMRIQAGDTTTVTRFRDRDNVDHDLTPPQIFDMWAKGSGFVSSVIQASWDVKDMDPIPLDYTDDKYWP